MAINSRAPLDRSPKKNWVENSGGLPMYIRRIANHLHQEKGMTISRAIAVAVNAVKRMCATGDVNWPGKQQVNAGSQSEACAAVADWERKKAQARVSKGIKGRKLSDREYIEILVKRDFSTQQREKLKRKGLTDPHGGFPIETVSDIKNAIRAIGRAKNPEMEKKRIKARAKKLGVENLIPDSWSAVQKSEMSDEEFADIMKNFGMSNVIEFELTGEIEKQDTEKGLVFGWASVAKRANGEVVVDKQGDVIEDIDAMEDVAYDFVLHSRDGGEMHVRKGVSTLVESFVSTPEKWEAMNIPEGTLPIGWWVGFKINDENVRKAVREGKYKMFSVHGTGMRKAYEDA